METIVIFVSASYACNDLNQMIGNRMTSHGYPNYIAKAVLSLAVLDTGDVLAVVQVRAMAESAQAGMK